MRRKYHYFISYTFYGGSGFCEYYLKRKLISFNQLKNIKDDLEKTNNIKNVTILFFRLFKEVGNEKGD
jgi:hypothetical protein